MRPAVILVLLLVASSARAQELEPRAYSASPVGLNFLAAGYGYTWGPVVLDPTIPIDDVSAKVHAFSVGYGRTFGFAGRQALVIAVLPFAAGHVSGRVLETDSSVTRTGLGDFRAKLSLNVLGVPALAPAEFATRTRSPWIGGASLTVMAPTGQYLKDKLVNIGAHRWAFKPEIGVSSFWWKKVYFDLYGGVWLYTANHTFYPGTSTRRQNPLASLQGHVSYNLRPLAWVALDYTWYGGGSTSTNEGPDSERLRNSRVGATGAWGLSARRSIKLNASTGASGRVGTKFRTVAVAYQLTWF